MKQRSTSEQKLSATVISDLEAIFTGASISKGTVHALDVPRVDLDFDCSRFYLGQVNKPIGKQVLFAPSKVQGTNILTWTLEWNTPYKVNNFLYITSEEVRYIFIYDNPDSDILTLINESIPEEMNAEFYEFDNDMEAITSAITDQNNYKVRLIFIGEFGERPRNIELRFEDAKYFPDQLSDMPGDDLTALFIKPHSSIDSINNLYFYDSDGTTFKKINDTYSLDHISSNSIGEAPPSLFGAIFTDDAHEYNCIMKKAFERLDWVSEIYLDKAEKLKSHYDVDYPKLICEKNVANAYIASPGESGPVGIEAIKDGADTCSQNFPEIDCVSQIAGAAEALETLNSRLLLFSCALIY